jgi:hypothetical protein
VGRCSDGTRQQGVHGCPHLPWQPGEPQLFQKYAGVVNRRSSTDGTTSGGRWHHARTAALPPPGSSQGRIHLALGKRVFCSAGSQQKECAEPVHRRYCLLFASAPLLPLVNTVRGKAAVERSLETLRSSYSALRLEVQQIYSRPRGLAVRYTRWWAERDGSWGLFGGILLFQFTADRIRQIGFPADTH